MIVAAFLTVPVTVSEYVLVPHRAHRLVVNMQPRLTAATAGSPGTTGIATGVRMKHIDGVVASASGDAVMAEHAVESIASRVPTGRCHDLYRERQ